MSSRVVPLSIIPIALLIGSSDVAGAAECRAWKIDYALSAKLTLSDTPMGAGDGTYNIGPGAMTLRFEDDDGKAGARAQMLAYTMRDYFTIDTRALFWRTKVTTRTNTRATPVNGVVAEGRLLGQALTWTSKVHGYRTDGYVVCNGAFCGQFDAPPDGRTELHIGPHEVAFKPLRFNPDLRRVSMPSTFVAKTKMPRQTAHLQLTGRELRRRAVTCQ